MQAVKTAYTRIVAAPLLRIKFSTMSVYLPSPSAQPPEPDMLHEINVRKSSPIFLLRWFLRQGKLDLLALSLSSDGKISETSFHISV